MIESDRNCLIVILFVLLLRYWTHKSTTRKTSHPKPDWELDTLDLGLKKVKTNCCGSGDGALRLDVCVCRCHRFDNADEDDVMVTLTVMTMMMMMTMMMVGISLVTLFLSRLCLSFCLACASSFGELGHAWWSLLQGFYCQIRCKRLFFGVTLQVWTCVKYVLKQSTP